MSKAAKRVALSVTTIHCDGGIVVAVVVGDYTEKLVVRVIIRHNYLPSTLTM